MKRLGAVILFSCLYSELFAQNELGPEGGKLLWILLGFILIVALGIIIIRYNKQPDKSKRETIFNFQRISAELQKSSNYRPDYLTLTVNNKGNTDIDLDRPLLVFDNFWLKRKFRLKGTNGRVFYPLFLEKGKTHVLKIDLQHFYGHDKRLRKFPKVKIYLANVKGKKLGNSSVFLRKTMFKF